MRKVHRMAEAGTTSREEVEGNSENRKISRKYARGLCVTGSGG